MHKHQGRERERERERESACVCVSVCTQPFTERTSEAYVGSVFMREHVNATVLAKREERKMNGVGCQNRERERERCELESHKRDRDASPSPRCSSSSEVLVFASG